MPFFKQDLLGPSRPVSQSPSLGLPAPWWGYRVTRPPWVRWAASVRAGEQVNSSFQKGCAWWLRQGGHKSITPSLCIEVEAVSLCALDITISHSDTQLRGVGRMSPQEDHHFSISALSDQKHPLWHLWEGKYKHRTHEHKKIPTKHPDGKAATPAILINFMPY